MHSRLLLSGLPRSLPPLPPLPPPACLPFIEGRQRAAPHSSFPPTTAPLQTLLMDVWGPAHVCGQGRERYFLLVVDDYTWYTTIFPLRSKGEVVNVLIPWIRTVRLQLRERFGQDLPVLRLHSERGGEFSSDLLRDFCRREGIRQSITFPDSPQQNGIAGRRIGLVMEVARTSMIHAAAHHFLLPFVVRYAAHQLILWPSVSLPETSPILRWTGKVGEASVFWVWGSRAFVRDTSADKRPPAPLPSSSLALSLTRVAGSFTTPPRAVSSLLRTSRSTSRFPSTVSSPTALPLPRPHRSSLLPVHLRLTPFRPRVAVISGAAPGAASGGAASGGAEPEGVEPGGAESEGAEPGCAESEGAESGGAEPRGAALSRGPAGASLQLSSQQLHECLIQRAHHRNGAPGASKPRDTGAGGAAVTIGALDPTEPGAAGAGGGGAGVARVGDPSAGGARAGGAGAVDPGAGGAGGTLRPRLYFVPLLQQVLGVPSSSGLPPPFLCPPPDQLQPMLQSASPLPVPSPYNEQSGGLTERPRAASPTVARLLATAVTDPSFDFAAASALVAQLLDFAVACRLDYAFALVAESVSASPTSVGGECALGMDILEDRQEDFKCLAAAVPRFASLLLAPEGDPDAPDIQTPCSYVEAITDTYINEVPPPGVNIVNGMWIFRVKQPPGSSPAFKARYVARGFTQRQGVDYFLTFSPTLKMTTLWVLLHVAAQHYYELHSLDFSTAFVQGSLHEEIWLLGPPSFTGSFPAGTQWSLCWPVYSLRQAPREWHDTLRTTLAALGFVPSTAHPSLFQRTDTSLPPFYFLVYVDDLVFATADTEALTLVKSELQKRHTCTDVFLLLCEWYIGRQRGGGAGPCTYVLRTGDRAGEQCGGPHSTHRCFGRLTDTWRHQFHDATEIPRWGDLTRAGVAIFDLDYDAILAAMYALSTSDEGDCYLCVPPDPGIEAAALGAGETAAQGASISAAPGAGESAPSGTVSAQVFHTFTLDSGASRSLFRDRTTLTPLSRPVAVSLADPSGGPVLASFSTVFLCPAAPSGSLSGLYLPSFSTNLVSGADLQDQGVDQFTPASQRVTHCTCARTGRHLATFTHRPGSSLYTLSTESPPVSASGQVAASSQTLLWHHRLGHPSLPRLRGMASRVLVSGLPRSLPPLPPGPAPTCVPCVEGRQRAAPHSTEFPPTEAPLQTLHMDVWGPARVRGQGHERYFLLVVDDYSRYTTVFPLRSKGEVTEFSSALLGAFCRAQGIRQTFTLPASPQKNGIAERRIGMVMDIARTSMIHAVAPHFLWPFAVGDASAFRVWGSRAFVRNLSADKLSPRATPCVFLGFPPDAPGWQFYHPTSRRVLSSQDVNFDESVPYYRLFPYRTASLPPPPLFLAPGPPPVDPLPPQGPAPSGVSQVDAVEPVEVAVDSGAAPGTEPAGAGSRGAETGGAEPGGAETGGAEPWGTEPGGAEPGGTEPGGAEPGGAGSARVASRGASSRGEVLSPLELREWFARRWGRATGAGGTTAAAGSEGSGSGGAGPGGTAEAAGVGPTGGSVGASAGPGAPGSAGTGAVGAPGVGAAGGVGAGGSADAGASEGAGVGAARAGGATDAGALAGSPGVVPAGSGGATRPGPYFVPLLEQVLGLPPSPGPAPPSECLQPVQSQSLFQPLSPLPAPSPYAGPTGGLAERRAPASRPASPARPACTSRRTSRPRPPAVPGTHQMTLRPSTAPLRVPLPSPLASSLPVLADPVSDSLCAASPTVARLLSTVVTDPSLVSTAASALVVELVDFAACCRLDYAASLVAESVSVCPQSVAGEFALSTDVLEDKQEEFQCFAAALPHLVSTLLAPEGDPDAPDIPTPRSYAEAIEGPYSSQWQAAMDAEMASWKSTGTYVDEVPPHGANIVSGMWIFRVKRPPGSPPVFKARYVARGFSQRQGVDYFQTFSPTPKMTTLRVLLHVAAQCDYELHSLDFSTAFLQGSLHEEIWLRRPPGFTGSFPPSTQWSLRRPVYGLRQAPREWHDTLRTTLAALGFAPSTVNPSLFLRTDTSLPPFYVLVYVDDLVFATADTAGLAHVKSKLQKRHTCIDLGELRSYLGLQITRDRAQCTITLTQSHMVQQVFQRFDFTYSSPQATPLSTRHSLSALPSDESVEPSGPYPELVGCLMYSMTCTRPDLAYPLSILARYVAPGRHRPKHMAAAKRVLRYLCSTSGMGLVLGGRRPVVLTGHADASWADDQATQSSSCEAEIYAGAMAAQELRWLTYLLTDLGEPPRSPPVLYVDNKAMLALCREHRLEHRTKQIALRYFLARELQQRGQLRLAYVASEALPPGDHQRFCTMLGLVPTWTHLLTS
ncbi:unnamed protein product [Closterium sp. NIES-54]